MATEAQFYAWLERESANGNIPLVAWGKQHTKIALDFAAYCERHAVDATIGSALNSSDGVYRP